MAITPPSFQSKLSPPIVNNNFLAMQSGLLTIGTGSASITFTNIPSSQRVTYKISNTGTRRAWIKGGNSANGPVVAVVSSSTPSPTSGSPSISNCDSIPAGAILTQDFVGGTNTIAAIVAVQSTTLEISIGGSQ